MGIEMTSTCEKTTREIASIGATLHLCLDVNTGFNYYLIGDFCEHLSQQMEGKGKDKIRLAEA